jgi:biotin carboxyl carrier protein
VAAVTQIGNGVYRVDDDGRQTIVYVARSAGDLWAFCDGDVFRERAPSDERAPVGPPKGGHYQLSAPMPATVIKIAVTAGQAVRQGETLVVLEAMKMELPIRAPADAVVRAVNCREGELVQPERTLVELA